MKARHYAYLLASVAAGAVGLGGLGRHLVEVDSWSVLWTSLEYQYSINSYSIMINQKYLQIFHMVIMIVLSALDKNLVMVTESYFCRLPRVSWK